MATKLKDLTSSVLGKLSTRAQEMFGDNEGFFRQGKFTPLQQYRDINATYDKLPIKNIGPLTVPNVSFKQVSTPEKQQQFTSGKDFGTQFLTNRFVAPMAQIPYNIRETFGGEEKSEYFLFVFFFYTNTVIRNADYPGSRGFFCFDCYLGCIA